MLDSVLGSAYRVPSCAHATWSLNDRDAIRLSEEAYRAEWDDLRGDQHALIARASELAGLADANRLLNEENARVIASAFRSFDGMIRILDVGAGTGDTTLSILESLDKSEWARAFFTLVDPAERLLEDADRKLRERGLREGEHFALHVASDLDIPTIVAQESQNIVTAVASIHHHAFLEGPFERCAWAVMQGGIFTTADWHHGLWEHPNRVLGLLRELRLRVPEEEMEGFVRSHPRAPEAIADVKDPREKRAREQIANFWIEYSELVGDEWRLQILEGHRPATRYIERMESVGMDTRGTPIGELIAANPYAILPESSLLCICVAQKT